VPISKKSDGDPGNVSTSVQERKARQVKSKIKYMLIIFFDMKRIAHKEFILAGQTVNSHITVAIYGNCLKMHTDVSLKFGDKRTGCCITICCLTLPFFTREFLTKATRLLSSTHPTLT
jgi:hypothetical protein